MPYTGRLERGPAKKMVFWYFPYLSQVGDGVGWEVVGAEQSAGGSGCLGSSCPHTHSDCEISKVPIKTECKGGSVWQTPSRLEFFQARRQDNVLPSADAGLCVSRRSRAGPSISNRSSLEMKKQ